MKKLLYILLLAFVSGMSITACTEQEIKPRDGGPGGTGSDPKGY